TNEKRVLRDGKQRSQAEDVPSENSGYGAGERDRDEAAGLPFKEKKFDSEKNSGDGRRKRGRHSTGGTRYEKCFPFSAGEMKQLGSERARGTKTEKAPRCFPAGETMAALQRPK